MNWIKWNIYVIYKEQFCLFPRKTQQEFNIFRFISTAYVIKNAKRLSNQRITNIHYEIADKQKNVVRILETYLTGVFFTGDVTGAEHVGGHWPITSVDLLTFLLIKDLYYQVSKYFRIRAIHLKLATRPCCTMWVAERLRTSACPSTRDPVNICRNDPEALGKRILMFTRG